MPLFTFKASEHAFRGFLAEDVRIYEMIEGLE